MTYGRADVLFCNRNGEPERVHALVPHELEERLRGLRGVRFLPAGSGMLFEFDGESRPFMTMEGVRLPLDILFIGTDERVLRIVHAVPGQAQISGPVTTRYVLELPYGYSRGRIRQGQLVRVCPK